MVKLPLYPWICEMTILLFPRLNYGCEMRCLQYKVFQQNIRSHSLYMMGQNILHDIQYAFGKHVLCFPDAFAFLSFLFFLAEKFNFSTNFQPHVGPMHCSRTHKFYFSATFSLKMGPTVLFTHLKIILLQCFSVFSCIQTDPKSKKNIWELPSSNVAEEDFLCTKMFIQAFLHHYPTVIIVQFIEI